MCGACTSSHIVGHTLSDISEHVLVLDSLTLEHRMMQLSHSLGLAWLPRTSLHFVVLEFRS